MCKIVLAHAQATRAVQNKKLQLRDVGDTPFVLFPRRKIPSGAGEGNRTLATGITNQLERSGLQSGWNITVSSAS